VKALTAIPLAAPLLEGAAGPVFAATRLQIDDAAWARINLSNTAWIDEVPLSDGASVDLRLTRINPYAPDARIVVVEANANGQPVEREIPLPEISAWRGSVAGVPNSSVFIAKSAAGLHGWIRFNNRTEIISSGDPAGGDAILISDAQCMPIQGVVCSDPPPMLDAGLEVEAPPVSGFAAAACRQIPIAVDTDQELLAKFGGNTTSASAYVATIFAGLTDIYSTDFNGRPSLCYLRLWSTTDPWTAADTSAQLTEFRSYWNTNMRSTSRAIATLLSTRSLGGGIAWLSQMCASTAGSGYGYSVCANLAGAFPYPLASRNSANWDIVVTAHEIGHNMSAQHTHDLGVDDCYTSSGLGACTQRTSGTIMSYCHLCTGGMTNINLNFDSVNIPSIISHLSSKSCTNPTVALPVALADTFTTLEGSNNIFDVLANDTNSNCESVTIQGLAVSSTLGVPLVINPTGSASGGPAIQYDTPHGISGIDTFTYRLLDSSNQSSATVTVSVDVKPVLFPFTGLSGNEPGLNSRFYNLVAPMTLPDFTLLTPYKYSTVPLLVYTSTSGSCVGSGLQDNFGAVFEGWIEAATEGNYTMSLTSDAGSQLYIDGLLVIDHNGIHTYSEKTNIVYLKAGFHSIRIPFFEATGACGLVLKWAVPGATSRVNVPSTALSHGGQIYDLDGSGIVDLGDLAYLMLDFGTICNSNPCYGDPNNQQIIGIDPNCTCPGDFDGSHEIDFGDAALLLLN